MWVLIFFFCSRESKNSFVLVYTGYGRKNSPIREGHSFGWGARRRTAAYVPFPVYTVAWSAEHGAFIVEEFIRNGGTPVACYLLAW